MSLLAKHGSIRLRSSLPVQEAERQLTSGQSAGTEARARVTNSHHKDILGLVEAKYSTQMKKLESIRHSKTGPATMIKTSKNLQQPCTTDHIALFKSNTEGRASRALAARLSAGKSEAAGMTQVGKEYVDNDGNVLFTVP